jgi:hypothetical protein
VSQEKNLGLPMDESNPKIIYEWGNYKMISQKQFNALSKTEQQQYLYLWSSLHEAQTMKDAIEYTENMMAKYKSNLTGLELAKVKADLSENYRYQGILEDIEQYSTHLKKIMAKLEA